MLIYKTFVCITNLADVTTNLVPLCSPSHAMSHETNFMFLAPLSTKVSLLFMSFQALASLYYYNAHCRIAEEMLDSAMCAEHSIATSMALLLWSDEPTTAYRLPKRGRLGRLLQDRQLVSRRSL